MFRWTLWQFGQTVSEFADFADSDMWAEMEARLFALTERGNTLAWPASEPVGGKTGLFVLRAKSAVAQGRLFYFFAFGQRIVFVHSVLAKKTRRLRQHDIDIALKRKRAIEQADDLSRLASPFVVELDDYQTH